MKNLLKVCFTAVLLAIIVAFAGFVLRKQRRAEDTLVVGMMSGWAPFMFINQQGEFEGFDVDVATEIAKRMGKKIEIQDLGSLAPLFISLEQQKIDMIFSGLDITQQRLEKLAMVRYTGQDTKSFYLVFWKNIPEDVKTIQDLKNISGAAVCVEPGSAQEKFLDQCEFVNKKPLASVVDMILDIRYGKSLAILLEPQVARRFQKQMPELQLLEVPLPKDFQVFGCGIAIKKQNDVLTNLTTKIVNEMKKDGTLKRLEIKWGLVEEQ